eukprot:247811-Karenia_brevis.AAC.1
MTCLKPLIAAQMRLSGAGQEEVAGNFTLQIQGNDITFMNDKQATWKQIRNKLKNFDSDGVASMSQAAD